MEDVVLQLSDSVMQRAQHAAKALQQPVERVLAQLVTAALPDLQDVPLEMQTELAGMTWLDTQTLWAVAASSMTEEQTDTQ